MGTTVTPTLRPATCWTSFSKRTPVQARGRPPRGPWARGQMVVELLPVGHLRAGHQEAQGQQVEPPAVEKVITLHMIFNK